MDASPASLWARSLPPLDTHPLVSVILAIRNEERFIAEALGSVVYQNYPRDRVEILVMDGGSTDRTIALVEEVAARDSRVVVLSNPRRWVACGLNSGLLASRGDVIVRVDGHCEIPPDYLRTCVDMLRGNLAESVGGPVRAVGGTALASGIAMAMSSPFGVGGATFRYANEARFVSHLPFAAWRREVFGRIGGFDESLVRNQDDEFSDRLRRAGGRILMNPGIAVRYRSRSTLRQLWHQYQGYGFWKVLVILKRGGRPSSVRHVLPCMLIVAFLSAAALGLTTGSWFGAALLLGFYGAFLAVATGWAAIRQRRPGALLVAPAIATMHFAYGIGFLAGCFFAALPPSGRRGAKVAT